MDLATLAQNLVTFLAPFLPYLLRAGEKAVEEMGEKFGAEAWERAKTLWGRLRGKPDIESAAQDVAAMPDDLDAQVALRLRLRKLLAGDEPLAKELIQLWEEMKVTGIAATAHRERSVAVGRDVTGSIIISGDVHVNAIDPETLKELFGKHSGSLPANIAAAQQETRREDQRQKEAEPRSTDASRWKIESPTVAVGSVIEFFPGTVYEAIIRQFHAGGYEIVLQYDHPRDKNPRITLLRDGTPIQPIIDSDERIIRFPKRTVWMTDKVVIPFGSEGGRPDKDTWMIELPSRPIAQRAIQQYGLEKVYISQEFIFEDGYRIVVAFNPGNLSDKRLEVYFYHQGKQI